MSKIFCHSRNIFCIGLENATKKYDNKKKLHDFLCRPSKMDRGIGMYYRAELDYLKNVLRKHRVQVLLLCPEEGPDRRVDFGLRESLGLEADYRRMFREYFQRCRGNVLYKLTDAFRCGYLFLRLSDTLRTTVLVIGPYLSFELSRQQLMEDAERMCLQPEQFRQLERYYGNVPVVGDEGFLLTLVNVFGERLWGDGDAYEIVDINQDLAGGAAPLAGSREQSQPEELMLNMRVMESRYAYENELMQMVSRGQTHRAELMLSRISQIGIECRQADPVRNMKNYSVIFNTLLRKAAENGGVHPVYLDSVSSDFARRIENLRGREDGQKLMEEMTRAYCRLVKKHSTTDYSPPVQRAVTYIDSDLSGDLSLRNLAAIQGVNASYLSALFKKETGQTVTEHVNRKRMDLARRLLKSTRLQVQSVAQHCGFSDVNYFSKLFKKHVGMTPKEFRNAPGT